MNRIKTPAKTIAEIRQKFQALKNKENIIVYSEMKRPGAVALVEFGSFATHNKALDMLRAAFPEKSFLVNLSAKTDVDGTPRPGGFYQIVLNSEDELLFLKLRESELLQVEE